MDIPVTTGQRGKRELAGGTVNGSSISAGRVWAFTTAGAVLAATYVNEKPPHFVQPVTEALDGKLRLQRSVPVPGQLEVVFERITPDWRRQFFLLRAIGFVSADDLQGRVVDCGPVASVWQWGHLAIHFCAWRPKLPPCQSNRWWISKMVMHWPRLSSALARYIAGNIIPAGGGQNAIP